MFDHYNYERMMLHLTGGHQFRRTRSGLNLRAVVRNAQASGGLLPVSRHLI